MNTLPNDVVLEAFREAYEFINPMLTNYSEFSKTLSRQIRVKDGGNIQYDFDVELDELLKRKLVDGGITGRVFSEESGWFDSGDEKYRVVFDPLCNSTLASRSILDAAVGMSVFDWDYNLVTSAVMDYQTGVVAMVHDGVTRFVQVQTGESIRFDRERAQSLDQAWVVLTLETQSERARVDEIVRVIRGSGRLFIGSGHIYWLRLAAGIVDAYLDPIGGEPWYEMFAASVAQGAGCIVTDREGNVFDPGKYLKVSIGADKRNYFPVAAGTPELHDELMNAVTETRNRFSKK